MLGMGVLAERDTTVLYDALICMGPNGVVSLGG